MPEAAPPIVLSIAGSDSGGGAGIQADLRSFAALGVHGCTAITAITAQDSQRVHAVHAVPVAMVEQQIDTLFADLPVAAVKTGMLAESALVEAVAARLRHWSPGALVVDPVIVASSGDRLLAEDAIAALRTRLVPLATVLTPNVPEAEALLGRPIRDRDDQLRAAIELRALGCGAVLLKGGHLPGEQVHDLLLDASGPHWFQHRRLARDGHGTGCTLAAALAARLAHGDTLQAAAARAIRFVADGLRAAYRPGRGHVAVLAHLAALRRTGKTRRAKK